MGTDKIKLSEEHFRNLVTQAPVAICILKGVEYIVELANEYYLQLVDQQVGFIGKPLFESLPDWDTQGIKEILKSVMQTGTPYFGNELEIHIIKDNERRQGFYNFVYQPINGDDGIVTGVIVVANEITEQVLARKKVEVQNLLFQNMLMTAPAFVATLRGPEHVYELVN